MNHAHSKNNQALAQRATPTDFKQYFEITDAAPGSESWRKCIDQLIDEIVVDCRAASLYSQDIGILISSLLSVRAIGNCVKPEEPDHTALRRWKLGHQAFHFILEGLIESIQVCRACLSAGDYDSLAKRFKNLAFLYRAATSAFRYAAEFDQCSYVDIVRPTMKPPHLPEGFSGTLNEKHNEMKRALRLLVEELSPVIAQEGLDSLKQAWGDVLAAKKENTDNHALICSRFVPGGQSLLREYYAKKQGDDDR